MSVLDLVRRATPSTVTAAAVTFYNIAPPSRIRTVRVVRREFAALASEDPVVIGGCEAVGHDPEAFAVAGYDTIRDRSTLSRANIVVLVRKGHRVRKVRWHDCASTWPRTEHAGRHEARSFVEMQVDGTQVVVAHAPPLAAGAEAQAELAWAIERVMAPVKVPTRGRRAIRRAKRHNARPRILIWDANREPGMFGPGADSIAREIGGRVVGDGVDCMVVRNATVEGSGYADTVDGVHLKTDHTRGRLRVRLSVAATFFKEIK